MVLISILLLMVIAMVVSNLLSTTAYAHGYVESPPSRAYRYSSRYLGVGDASMVGGAAYEPQSLGKHFNNGWPHSPQSPPDGRLASADCIRGCPEIDRQSSTLWAKTNIQTGWNVFTWLYTAWHATAKWEFFITKQGWNQNAPLSRHSFDLEPIAVEQYNGHNPGSGGRTSHQVFIPHDRSGYHVVYAVWTTTPGQNNETFYNVIDLNITGGNGGPGPGPSPGPTTFPPAVTGLSAQVQSPTTVQLGWHAAPANAQVNSYDIFRSINGGMFTAIKSTTSTSFTDTVPATATVQYYVIAYNAIGGSPQGTTVSVTMPNEPGPGPGPGPGGITTWDPFAKYNVGDIVLYNGRKYQSLITYQGFGDPNWGPGSAPFWQLVE